MKFNEWLTQYDVCFGSLLFQELRVIIATKHSADIWESFLHDIRFFLRAYKHGVFVVWVLLVQCVESIASDVAGHASAMPRQLRVCRNDHRSDRTGRFWGPYCAC
jgi:hypothetical protein